MSWVTVESFRVPSSEFQVAGIWGEPVRAVRRPNCLDCPTLGSCGHVIRPARQLFRPYWSMDKGLWAEKFLDPCNAKGRLAVLCRYNPPVRPGQPSKTFA